MPIDIETLIQDAVTLFTHVGSSDDFETELRARIRELQQSVSVPSEPLVSRSLAARTAAAIAEFYHKKALEFQVNSHSYEEFLARGIGAQEAAKKIAALSAVSIPVPADASELVRQWVAQSPQSNIADEDAEDLTFRIIAYAAGRSPAPSPSEEA